MSGLVLMLVLAYLLVIAVAVAMWSAVSIRRMSGEELERSDRNAGQERTHGDRRGTAESHDAYRGVHARRRSPEASLADPYRADRSSERRAEAVGVTGKAVARPQRTETAKREVRTDGIRVLESRRERERKAEAKAAERSVNDDAFERFLRANEDLER